MSRRKKDLIKPLDELLQQAVETSQVEIYGQHSFIYHAGFYSNRTTLWSHSPTLLAPVERGYLITATPKNALRLAVLESNALSILLHNRHLPDACQQLLRLCDHLEAYCPACGLDGFATTPLEGGSHYRHIVLFRPLDALSLYDIEPL